MSEVTGPVLVTGAAGFIGHAVARRLLGQGVEVTGIDNLCTGYYDPALKHLRLEDLRGEAGFEFAAVDFTDAADTARVIDESGARTIIHLGAKASVMPSFEDPLGYTMSNVVGTQVILEAARRARAVEHVVYASTSSVYGRSRDRKTPFHEEMPISEPVSVYGASKVANEATAQVYWDRYALPVTGLRFFKVYGPWGRPDTVFYKFVDRIHRGEPIRMHNFGNITHAFTYIDDIVDGVVGAAARPPLPAEGRHPIYNLGNPQSADLGLCVDLIEEALGREAIREAVELPAGDRTFSRADISKAQEAFGYAVKTPVEVGIPQLVSWYLETCAPRGTSFS